MIQFHTKFMGIVDPQQSYLDTVYSGMSECWGKFKPERKSGYYPDGVHL